MGGVWCVESLLELTTNGMGTAGRTVILKVEHPKMADENVNGEPRHIG
jgi:hypothetical protein